MGVEGKVPSALLNKPGSGRDRGISREKEDVRVRAEVLYLVSGVEAGEDINVRGGRSEYWRGQRGGSGSSPLSRRNGTIAKWGTGRRCAHLRT